MQASCMTENSVCMLQVGFDAFFLNLKGSETRLF